MKRYILFFVLFLALFSNFFCEKGATLKEENARLTKEIVKLKQENEVLKDRNTSLEKQVKDLSEAPAALYERAQQYKGQELYDEAIRALEKLAIKASGQSLAYKAQTEIAVLKNLKAQKERAEERAKRDAFQDIGGGFGVRRINAKSSFGMTEILGEIKNNSGQSYTLVNIVVALYDSENNLIDNAIANISNFAAGSIKSFSAYGSVSLDRIARYKVQFENAI